MARSPSMIRWPMPRFICGSRSIPMAVRGSTSSTPSRIRRIRRAIAALISPAVTPCGTFDSDMPDSLAHFLSDAMKSVFWPNNLPPAGLNPHNQPFTPLNADPKGPVSCCPTIISTLKGIVPLETGGFAEADDITGAYFYVFKYMKFTTTDYYKIRRPASARSLRNPVLSFATRLRRFRSGTRRRR